MNLTISINDSWGLTVRLWFTNAGSKWSVHIFDRDRGHSRSNQLFIWSHGVFSLCSIITDEDAFSIRHSVTEKCLVAEAPAGLSLSACDPNNGSQLWKWGSAHRLFHVETSLCLGLEVSSKTLTLLECGSDSLLWRCLDGAVYTVYQMGLAVSDGKVIAKRDSSDVWVREGSNDNICQRPYHGECAFPYVGRERESAHRSVSTVKSALSSPLQRSEDWLMPEEVLSQGVKEGKCSVCKVKCTVLNSELQGGSTPISHP